MNERPSPNLNLGVAEQIERIRSFLAPRPEQRDAYDVVIGGLDIAANQQAIDEFKDAEQYGGWRQYLDCAYWIYQRLEQSQSFSLRNVEPLKILDLAMRGGHFSFVCQAFGHEVRGLDDNHVITKRIAEILQVPRIEYPIRRREFLPPFRMKFDLVTALQAQFDSVGKGEYWTTDDWSWFLHNLIANHCQVPSRIHLALVHGVNPNTGQKVLKESAAAAFIAYGGNGDVKTGVMRLSVNKSLVASVRLPVRHEFISSALEPSASTSPATAAHHHCRGVFAIFGNSYSGSTLFNALLGSHPDIAGGGELHWLITDPTKGKCSLCGESCEIWTQERRQRISLTNLYDMTAEAFRRPFIVDASKMPDWFTKILPICDEAQVPVRRILLVKHPVRHVASFVEKARRQEHLKQYRTVDATLTTLANWYLYTFRRVSFDQIIRYEDLVTTPRQVVADTLAAFGLRYDSRIDDWQIQTHHHIGGNAGPRTQMARHIKPTGEFLKQKYSRDGVFLDNSYLDLLTADEIAAIQDSGEARFMCKMFGYSPDPAEPTLMVAREIA